MAERTAVVIDDEEYVVSLIQTILEDEGFEVVTAYDGETGWARIQESQPDVVITDIHMPKMDGMAICRACEPLRESRRFPIFVLTGETDRENKSWLAQQSDLYLVSKPFSPRGLAVQVLEAVTRCGSGATADESHEAHYG